MRWEIKRFAEVMEYNLKSNDRKGGWHNCPIEFLTHKLHEEVSELMIVLQDPRLYSDNEDTRQFFIERLVSEAADVANIAMMFADNVKEGRFH